MELVRQSISYEWKGIIKRGLWLLSIPILDIMYFILNTHPGKTVIIETSIDKWIPFNKYFVIPYLCWYGYVFFFLMYFCIIDASVYCKFLICIDAGLIISFIIFYFYPSTVIRPIVHGNDIFDKLIRLVYAKDNPVNCFPSIHVLNALLVEIFVIQHEACSRLTKIVTSVICILIILSTLFIKQHYLMDVVSASVLACILYFSICSVEILKQNTKIKA